MLHKQYRLIYWGSWNVRRSMKALMFTLNLSTSVLEHVAWYDSTYGKHTHTHTHTYFMHFYIYKIKTLQISYRELNCINPDTTTFHSRIARSDWLLRVMWAQRFKHPFITYWQFDSQKVTGYAILISAPLKSVDDLLQINILTICNPYEYGHIYHRSQSCIPLENEKSLEKLINAHTHTHTRCSAAVM